MRSVTVNCSALTPESHSQPTAEPRPASTGSKWFVKAERSSCGTARLCPAAMPESNCRRCLEQDSNVLIDEVSPKYFVRIPVRRSLMYRYSTLHAVMQSHCAAVPSGTSTWLGEAGRAEWWGRSVSRRSGSRRHGTVRSLRHGQRLCRTAFQKRAGRLDGWFDLGLKTFDRGFSPAHHRVV
jgi:hypothetical protein